MAKEFYWFSLILCFAINSNASTTVQRQETRKGKTFQSVIVSAGFTAKEAEILLADEAIPTKMHLNAGEYYLILKNPATRRLEMRVYLDYSDEALVFWKEVGKIGVAIQPVDYKITLKKVSGKIRGSLGESMKRHISDDWPVYRFSDAFSWNLNLNKELMKNDAFEFTIEEKYDYGKFIKFGEITKAQLETGGETYKRILWQNAETKVFVDPDTRFEDRYFYAPVDYVHISSPYAKRRFHPVRRNFQPHLGVDFAINEGAPVYAAREGVVEAATRHRGNGKFITLKHGSEIYTIYNHLKSWAPGIFIGKRVAAGEVIGFVGCTGYCTSPHLDFRIRHRDTFYDPITLTKPFPYKERGYFETPRYKQLVGLIDKS